MHVSFVTSDAPYFASHVLVLPLPIALDSPERRSFMRCLVKCLAQCEAPLALLSLSQMNSLALPALASEWGCEAEIAEYVRSFVQLPLYFISSLFLFYLFISLPFSCFLEPDIQIKADIYIYIYIYLKQQIARLAPSFVNNKQIGLYIGCTLAAQL